MNPEAKGRAHLTCGHWTYIIPWADVEDLATARTVRCEKCGATGLVDRTRELDARNRLGSETRRAREAADKASTRQAHSAFGTRARSVKRAFPTP